MDAVRTSHPWPGPVPCSKCILKSFGDIPKTPQGSQRQRTKGLNWQGPGPSPQLTNRAWFCFVRALVATLDFFWARSSFSKKTVALWPKVSDQKMQHESGRSRRQGIRSEKPLPYYSLQCSPCFGWLPEGRLRPVLMCPEQLFNIDCFPFLTESTSCRLQAIGQQ